MSGTLKIGPPIGTTEIKEASLCRTGHLCTLPTGHRGVPSPFPLGPRVFGEGESLTCLVSKTLGAGSWKEDWGETMFP